MTPIDEPLARVVEELVLTTDPVATPGQMANSVATLQLDLADPDFHAEALRGARAVRPHPARPGRRPRNGRAALRHRPRDARKLIETAYHGSMIGWAIHRESTLADWMREQLVAVLASHRTAS